MRVGMQAGQRYYIITYLPTNESIEDWLGETIRFNTEEDAQDYIDDIIDSAEDESVAANYRIDCLRW